MCQIARIHVRIDLFVGPDLDPRCLRYSSRCELFNLQLKLLENKKNIYKIMCQIARIHVRIDLFVGPDLDPRCLRGSSADKTNHAKNNKLLCRICMRSHECNTKECM